MAPLLYDELTPWYYLVDPTADHEDEATCYGAALDRAAPQAKSLLELGSGGGNNLFFLKKRFRCTATDLSEGMLGLNKKLNPECEHLAGDMRTLRLDRTFDTVLVHDAVAYMTTEDDLRAAITTTFVHTARGGVAVFVPDFLRETFHEGHECLGTDEGSRGLRAVAWIRDPDPSDTTYVVDYAFLLREGDVVRAVHDQHTEGLFPRQTWIDLLSAAGYSTTVEQTDLGDGMSGEMFVCRKP